MDLACDRPSGYSPNMETPLFDALSIPVTLVFIGVLAVGALVEKWVDSIAARRSAESPPLENPRTE